MSTNIELDLERLPAAVKQTVLKIITSPHFDATLSQKEVEHLIRLSGWSEKTLLLALLPLAARYAVVPISHFKVGAMARGETGRLYFGANMEFLGVPLNQSVHAEQSAISHAWIKGETRITDITINYSPCGHCRQFMNELQGAENLIVRLPDKDEKTLHEYLPEAFGPLDLGVTKGLLCPTDHGFTLGNIQSFIHDPQIKSAQIEDALINAALHAANRSHAPYSKNVSGVAIRDMDGQIFSGMSAENAAFNPSLAPLQVALNAMNLAGVDLIKIKEVVLIEKENAPVSYLQDTKRILHLLNDEIKLTSFLI